MLQFLGQANESVGWFSGPSEVGTSSFLERKCTGKVSLKQEASHDSTEGSLGNSQQDCRQRDGKHHHLSQLQPFGSTWDAGNFCLLHRNNALVGCQRT
jgi:hypothetical protein